MTKAQRTILAGVMEFLVEQTSQIGYLQKRPMGTGTVKSMVALGALCEQGFSMDCSESVVLICHLGGVGDPTGNNFDGYGNTESMLAHLPHYTDATKAGAGAIFIFNSDRPLVEQHVAITHTPDPVNGNPVLFTHGHTSDPRLAAFHDLRTGFAGKTTILNVATL